jgi:hypothetical protein
MPDRASGFAAVYALIRAAAAVGDHWIQSDRDARIKGATDDSPVTLVDPETGTKTVHGTVDGRKACARHCLTYTATQAAALVAGSRALGLRLRPGPVAAALTISYVTHYAADRRVPGGLLQRLADATGKGRFWRLADHGINGAYALDAAWHHGWEAIAAVVASAPAD